MPEPPSRRRLLKRPSWRSQSNTLEPFRASTSRWKSFIVGTCQLENGTPETLIGPAPLLRRNAAFAPRPPRLLYISPKLLRLTVGVVRSWTHIWWVLVSITLLAGTPGFNERACDSKF